MRKPKKPKPKINPDWRSDSSGDADPLTGLNRSGVKAPFDVGFDEWWKLSRSERLLRILGLRVLRGESGPPSPILRQKVEDYFTKKDGRDGRPKTDTDEKLKLTYKLAYEVLKLGHSGLKRVTREKLLKHVATRNKVSYTAVKDAVKYCRDNYKSPVKNPVQFDSDGNPKKPKNPR